MKFQTKAALLAVVVVVGFAAFFVTSRPKKPTENPHSLVIALDQGPVTLDPVAAMDTGSGAFLPLLHAPLLLRAKDGTLRPIIAESASMSEDGLSCMIRLKENARFWDGSPLTPDDVIYSLTRFGRSGHPFAWAMNRIAGMEGSGDVTGLRETDGNTLEVQFSEPDPDWLWFIATPLVSIVKKGTADSPKQSFDLQVVGAGPYRLADFDPGSRFKFVQNKGFPIASSIAEIEILIVENPQRQLELAERGEVDVVRLNGPMIGEALTSLTGTKETPLRKSLDHMKVVSAQANEELFLLLNLRSGPFAAMSSEERQALKLSMATRLANPETINSLYGPYARPVQGISPRIQIPLNEARNATPAGLPDRARLLVPNVPDSRRLASLVVAHAAELGLEFEVIHSDLAEAVGKAIGGEFDAMVFWVASQPAHAALPWFMFFDERTGFTALGQAVPQLGEDVEKVRGILDDEERAAQYVDLIGKVSSRQTSWIPIASRDTLLLAPDRLLGELLDWNGVPVFYGLDIHD